MARRRYFTRSRRRPRRRSETPQEAAPPTTEQAEDGPPRPLTIPRVLTVKDLADQMAVSPVEVIKELMKNGVMAGINQVIDFETAAIVAHDLGFEPEETPPQETAEVAVAPSGRPRIDEEDESALQPRPPVVTVMGHVDHGKTSILDAIRETHVAPSEVGGITQHIGAYQVEANGQRITFLDTPGHEAFTAMRARGAQVTDVAVLVVAADDGVMPQTEEAIDHARAAGVPIVVALNKMDLPDVNPDRVKQQIAEHGLVLEEWGGDTICVPMSAKTTDGLQNLLENILVVAELLELKANPDRPAIGTVVEAELNTTRGPMATVLVETGTLCTGDVVVAAETWGRVKAMFNELGKRIKAAAPGEPAEILGLQEVPRAGDIVTVVKNERTARSIVLQRIREREAATFHEQRRVSLDTLFGEISAGKVRELNIILKTDVQGSIEPIRTSLERLSTEQAKVKIIHSGSGTVTESDVMLAVASGAIVIGFSTKPEPGALRLAAAEGVDMRDYSVIYNLIEDVERALKGLLEPVFKEVVVAQAEVRQVFKVRRGQVAGCVVREGAVSRGDLARVLRGEEAITESRVDSLRRFQEDVREVQAGMECGIGLEGFGDFQEGDVLELYRRERAS
jgi:translation initiation factor IF-2